MYDVLVVGGGPAGSTAATLLQKKGFRVALLEKEKFPRFQIGESLLPYNNDVFRDLGLTDRLEAQAFVPKFGATFLTGDGQRAHSFRFGRTLPKCYARSYQVKRADFDTVLLDHARSSGVEVFEETAVSSVDLSDPKRVVARASHEGGEARTFEARFIVDASGHGTVVGSRLGMKVESESLKKISFFAHYADVRPDPDGRPSGDTVIVVVRDGWFWMIPLSDGSVSVGLVTDREAYKASGLTPEALLDQMIRRTPYVAARMDEARRIGAVRARKDFTYRMRELTGSNFALVGDAAGFIDPIFSTGVFMAMRSAQITAEAVEAYLNSGNRAPLRRYSSQFVRAYEKYLRFVSNFYTREFIEVFLQPSDRFGILPVVIDILAGSVFEKRRDRFKLWAFFTLVKLQRRLGIIAPRIAWDRLPTTAGA